MALLLPKSLFIHIPKTGGMWVRQAIRNAGIPTDEIFSSEQTTDVPLASLVHARSHNIRIMDRLRFAFVRHPLTYMQSYWCYKMERGWDASNPFDLIHRHDNFQGFVRSILSVHPKGWVTQCYMETIGTAGWRVDFVGRTEQLEDDLIVALSLAGEQFDPAHIRRTPPHNVVSRSTKWMQYCTYSDTLREEVCAAEHRTLEWFGYDTNLPQESLQRPQHALLVT